MRDVDFLSGARRYAVAAFRRAIALSPGLPVYGWLSGLLRYL